jgi:hypothetical protein
MSNLISILSTFLLAQVLMMSVLNLIFGKIVFLNFNVIKSIMVKDILFFCFNTFILLHFTTFYQPH